MTPPVHLSASRGNSSAAPQRNRPAPSGTGDSFSSAAPLSGESAPLSGARPLPGTRPLSGTSNPISAATRRSPSSLSDNQREPSSAAPSAARRGLFITFEGGEGCGKSVQISRFAEYLRTRGCDVVMTREPGGTPVGKEIRRLLVEGDKDKFDEITEILLFYADRRIDLTQVVFPALAAGKCVLSDRFNDSTVAYQFYGSGKFADTEIMDRLYKIVAGDFKPDLTFLLDIDPRTGLERSFRKAQTMAHKELRFENVDIAFHERLRRGYLELAAAEPERFVVIDAAGTIDEVAERITAAFQARGFA